MPKETEWQTRICHKIRSEDGFARKWATQLVAGPPDLILFLPYRGAVLCEVKRFPSMHRSRKHNVTAQQQKVLREWQDAGGECCILTVIESGPSDYAFPRFQLTWGVPCGTMISPEWGTHYWWQGPSTGANLTNWMRNRLNGYQ